MARGAADHVEPAGAGGMLILHVFFSGTNIENAIDFPSGDHRGLRGDSVTCVTGVAGPSTSIQRTKICEPLGSPSDVYKIRLPSDDQRAPAPLTRNRFCVPSVFTIHSADSHLSVS